MTVLQTHHRLHDTLVGVGGCLVNTCLACHVQQLGVSSSRDLPK